MATTDLLAGAARVEITPNGPQWLDGYGNRTAPSDGVYLPIAARALFLARGHRRALIVSAEVLAFDLEQAARLKAALAQATDVPEAAIVLAATHTHCAPRVCEMAMPGEIDPTYRTWFETQLVEAGRQARREPVPVQVRCARTTWDLGVNRRFPTPAGMVMRPYPAGPTDPEVTTLWFERSGGDPVATLTIYACHPTARGGTQIGGDYPGALMTELEREPGGVHLFLLGCAGDIRPAFTDATGGFRMAEIAEVLACGAELAARVRVARETAALLPVSRLAAARTWVTLPFAGRPDSATLQATATSDPAPLRRLWAARLLPRAPLPQSVSAELQVLSLGPACTLVCFAGEMVVDYARWLKSGYPGALPAAYCNGTVGYVPSRRIYPEGGYEVNGSHYYYLQPAPFRPEVEDCIQHATEALLAEMADP